MNSLDSPKYGLIRNKENRNLDKMSAKLDVSVTMSTSEIRRFMSNSNDTLTSFKNTFMEESTKDVLTAKQKTDLLYSHFLEILQSRTNDSEVFDTVQDLIAGNELIVVYYIPRPGNINKKLCVVECYCTTKNQ